MHFGHCDPIDGERLHVHLQAREVVFVGRWIGELFTSGAVGSMPPLDVSLDVPLVRPTTVWRDIRSKIKYIYYIIFPLKASPAPFITAMRGAAILFFSCQ